MPSGFIENDGVVQCSAQRSGVLMPCYFFSFNRYIRVNRGDIGPGIVDLQYPAPISNWGWGEFGRNGIDAALYSGSKCYFFSGNQYIRVTRGDTGAGTVDGGYPAPISNWGWGEFGKNGIDAALYSGSKCYFFSGKQYIRVTRGDTGAGTVDGGYPAQISQWGWGEFGANGIRTALFSGTDTPIGSIVSPPSRLGDNSNYFIHAGGTPLTGVVVTINIQEDLAFKSATVTDGFSFQLNSYGPKGSQSQFQQYVLALRDMQYYGAINNYGPTQTSPSGLIDSNNPMHSLSAYILKAGCQSKISLLSNAASAITGATFSVIDENGQKVVESTFNIPPGVPISPIVAFVLNIVGADDKAHAIFASGSGSIIYQADNALAVMSDFPSFVASDGFSVELSTSVYGELNAGPAFGLSQHFGVTPDGSFI